MLKWVVIFVFACIAIFAAWPTQAGPEFPDVPWDHWAYDAVTYLEDEGLIIGYPDGTFQGDRPLTRYEFAIVVSRAYDQFLEMLDDVDTKPSIDVEAVLDILLDEFQPEIDELRELIGANTGRIEVLEDTVGTYDCRINEIQCRVDGMDNRFHPYGDFALRFDGAYPDDGSQTQRPRMQLRWGFTSRIDCELILGARFTTGKEGGRQSAWDTYDDAFGFDGLNIDRAYLQWQPDSSPGFTMWGGKFSPPWQITPVSFDSDVTVEGLAQHYNHDRFNFYLAEMTPVEKGFYLLAQIGYDDLFAEKLNTAITYHYINDDAWFFIRRDMESGALTSNWDFSRLESPDDYRAFEWYCEWSHRLGTVPFKLQTDYLINLEDTAPGLLGGAGWQQAAWARLTLFDKPSEVHDWNVRGEIGRIQANSVLSWLTDASRGMGDHEFWAVGWTYRLLRNTDFAVTYYNLQRLSDPSDASEILQLQVTSRFM